MKILVWNIQFFTKRRIEDSSAGNIDTVVENFLRTLANLTYITSTARQAAPDVFVIVEPQSSQGTVSALSGGGGPDGLLYLLTQLREYVQGADWQLVPPLRLNPQDQLSTRTYTECIGVFWNNTTMDFTGPWVWTAAGARENGTPAAYGDPWKAAVPDGNTAAGQCLFSDGNNGYLKFPEDINRRPFLTRFTERATNRVLKLYAVHTSPSSARDACGRMLSIAGMKPQANEITVLTGDFNLNLNSLNLIESATVQAFSGQNVDLVSPRVISQSLFGGTKYEATRVKPRTTATWDAYPTAQVLDYAFVGYGTGAKQPPNFQATVQVVDRVAGTPAPPFDADMVNPLAEYPDIEPTDEDPDLALTTFRERWNYGHIAQPQRTVKTDDSTLDGTSDHLPILVTV